jgi:hypothetical protein
MELPKLTTQQIIGGAAIGVGALALGGVAAIAISKKRKKRKKYTKNKVSRKRVSRNKKGRKLKFGSKAWRRKYIKNGRRKQKQPYTARKKRDTSTRRIRFTKNNQPYIIKSDGRARFIKKSSVSRSRKLKGGKY